MVAAGAAALILSTHTFTRAQLVRVKLIQSSRHAADGEIRAGTARFPDARLLKPPFALIAFVDVPTTDEARLTVSIDGRPVCERSPGTGLARRIDCAVTGSWDPSVAHEIAIRAATTTWTLRSLEIATHHGHTSGATYLLFLPSGAGNFARSSAGYIILVSVVLGCVLAAPWPRRLPRVMEVIYAIVAATIVVLLIVIQVSDHFSPYVVVLSGGTFIRWTLWLLLPWIWPIGRWLLTPSVAAADDRLMAWARSVVLAAVVVIAYSVVVTSRVNDYYGGNYSGLLVLSRVMFDNNPLLAGRDDVRSRVVLQVTGYDGQFMYYAMFDPFLRRFSANPTAYRRVVDTPPYRYGRIGFPILALILSGGQWERFPIVMMWLILGGLGLFALLLARMGQHAGIGAGVGGLALLVPGFWQSAQLSLPEPIAAASLLAGIVCVSRRRWLLAAAFFAASLLTRETGVVAIACVLAAESLQGRLRPAIACGLAAVAVMAAWRLYVAWMLFPDWGVEGLLFHPPDLGLPLAGIVDLWRAVAHGAYYPDVADLRRAAIAYPFLLMYGFGLAVALAAVRPNAWHVAAVVYGLIAISLNLPAIWVHVSNAQRGTFELFVMLAVSMLAVREYPRRLRLATVGFWSCSFVYIFFLGYDAGYIRSILPMI
jgi:hypothetical protein